MSLSGTTAYNPNLGELFITAFSRIGVKRTELLSAHMQDARNESNLAQVEFVNAGVLLWKQVLNTFTMVAGQSTYDIPPQTIMILDLYVNPNAGSGFLENRLLFPFSRTDYASLANPNEPGFPTSFFFLRTVNPTVTFWPVPDNNTTYQCSYWSYVQLDDAVPTQGGNADLDYRFLDAFVAKLAHRLSRMYNPSLEAMRKADADEAFALAMKQDTENVAMYINCGLSGYFRN
jgi:hypothetical protein